MQVCSRLKARQNRWAMLKVRLSFTSPLYAYRYFAKQIGSNTVYFYIRLQTLEVNTFKKQMKLQLTVGHQLCSEDVYMSGVYNPACYYSWGSDVQKQAQDYIREAPLEVLSNFIQNQKYIDIQMTRTQ